MRAPSTILLSLLTTLASAAVLEHVAEGEPHPRSVLRVGTGHLSSVRRDPGDEEYRTWLSVCVDLEHGEALRKACAAALRTLAPQPSVLVSGFHAAGADLPTADGPWMLSVGDKVPTAVLRAVLRSVRDAHPGPLVLRGWNDETMIISIGPVSADAPPAADAATLARLGGALTDAELRAAFAPRPVTPIPAPATAATAEPVLDLDLRSPDGKPPGKTDALRTVGTTWTPEGLFLPGSHLLRFPPRYPVQDTAAPVPPAPYQAELTVPGAAERALTITLLICQASQAPEQGNLFMLGRRSRWLSAQVGTASELLVGIDNRWRMLLARTADDKALILGARVWHAVTVGAGADGRLIRVVVDGRAAKDLNVDQDPANVPPRRFVDAGDDVLSFVDPGTPRHLHGLVRRVIVHHGLLDLPAILALHGTLAPTTLPPPTTPAFATPLAGTGLPSDDLPKLPPTPKGADDF